MSLLPISSTPISTSSRPQHGRLKAEGFGHLAQLFIMVRIKAQSALFQLAVLWALIHGRSSVVLVVLCDRPCFACGFACFFCLFVLAAFFLGFHSQLYVRLA